MRLIDQRNSATPSVRCSDTEWSARVDLAACYRLADAHRMGKIIWNHITARVPDSPQEILVFRLGCRFDEVTASNLMKVDLSGNPIDGSEEELNLAANVIHGGNLPRSPRCYVRDAQSQPWGAGGFMPQGRFNPNLARGDDVLRRYRVPRL